MNKLIAFVLFLACTMLAHAQIMPQKPASETVTRLARDSRPLPGIFCGQERITAMFDEYSYATVDQSLVTVEHVNRCLRTLPKKFLRTTEQIFGIVAEDLRGSEGPSMGCSILKPVGRPPQYKIWFAIPQSVKQGQIDDCFERARNSPNRLRSAPTSDI